MKADKGGLSLIPHDLSPQGREKAVKSEYIHAVLEGDLPPLKTVFSLKPPSVPL